MSKGGGSTDVIQRTTTTDPSPFSQRFLEPGYQQAQQDILNRPTTYFPGSTVVACAPETAGSLNLTTTRALGGSPLRQAGLNQAFQTLRGDFVGQENPAYQAMVDRSVRPLTQQFERDVGGIRGAASRAGRGGSNIATQRALADANEAYLQSVGDVGAQLAYPDYQAERAYQQQMVGAAPSLAATDYDDLVRLGAVGAAREGQLGAQLAEDVARFEFAQREPGQRVTQYLAAVGGGGGGTTQRSLDPYTPANPLLGLLGGAATGAAMIPTGYTGSIAPFIGGGAALGGLSAFV